MKYILLLTFLCNISLYNISYAGDIDDARKYMDNFQDEVELIVKNNDISLDEQKIKLSSLIEDNINNIWICKFVLGNKGRKLQKDQIIKFCNLYSKYIINFYLNQFQGYKGELFKINNIDSKSNFINVSSNILLDNGQLINLIFRISNRYGNDFKMYDIIVENVSFLISQRNEINSAMDKGYNFVINNLNNRLNNND